MTTPSTDHATPIDDEAEVATDVEEDNNDCISTRRKCKASMKIPSRRKPPRKPYGGHITTQQFQTRGGRAGITATETPAPKVVRHITTKRIGKLTGDGEGKSGVRRDGCVVRNCREP
ncbi:hypothetical protein Cantr_07286 [Candida viswanathii]|uniref:Uncharacterized protein n=1 Tax=Candida viswanathii TaxID=5486 RepID=A0A367Y0G5_9ASCO|nr:hypothetical protein Cantr_07286 [Candida viswanathii]